MLQSNLIIAEPRRRKQTTRFGGQQSAARIDEISDLDSSASDNSDGEGRGRSAKGLKLGRKGRGKKDDDFEIDDNAPPPGCYTRPECFKVSYLSILLK